MITEQEIIELKNAYMRKNFVVRNSESDKCKDAYLTAIRDVIEKMNMDPACNNDCNGYEFGNCANRDNCKKFYF